MPDIEAIVAQLGLAPHPEGGWYRETWRAPAREGDRSAGTAILFALDAEKPSHWHRVDATELWFWHAGAPLDLHIAADDRGPVRTTRLGPADVSGYAAQGIVPAGNWQAAEAIGGWTLVSCVVVPGFDFSGFELAPPDWTPGR
ncbi:cupin domain-containing protein [Stakelama marina]|uniref:Cupin domain-containing protein n=1 Tax=Stakelama marina TaxID=2826939 RepID=A0A8T4IKX8_9SPHN|nr:cupin domain-containing protein [Stakelama marina]MBR0553775.1 cupin domain-containing protein [Stakelama marina]